MLVVTRGDQSIAHAHVRDLPEYLRPDDCLVLNDTRVLPARLVGYRVATGGRWSGLFLAADPAGHWEVMCKTRGRLRAGERIMLEDRQADDAFPLTLLADLGDGLWAAQPAGLVQPTELLEEVGRVPLPPYIRGGEMEESDVEQYQTVFARQPGRDCRPDRRPALHQRIAGTTCRCGRGHLPRHAARGIGTFRPIAARRIEDHAMHSEWGEIGGHRATDRPAVPRADAWWPWAPPVSECWKRPRATGNCRPGRARPICSFDRRTRFGVSTRC